MIKKIASQFATVVVLFLVILFCMPNTAAHSNRKSPTGSETQMPEPSVTGAIPPLTTDAPAAPTKPEDTVSTPTQPQTIHMTTAPEGYFADALFIGDSRTVGLNEYGDLTGATFFATSGMDVYSIFSEKVSGTTFENLMTSRKFGKIYVMLGINELCYGLENIVAEYEKLIGWIRQKQPEAILYLEANLHVSANRSNTDSIYNNPNLDAFNARIAEFADGQQIFYLDVNPLFDDGQGNLAEEYTSDDTHILGIYYRSWTQWIAEHAALPQT